jgi:hypothetical protein
MSARKLSREIAPYADADGVPGVPHTPIMPQWEDLWSVPLSTQGIWVGILLGTPHLILNRNDFNAQQGPAIQHGMTTGPVESIRHNIVAHLSPTCL